MNSIKKSLESWLNELNNFSFKSYEELPELDLYMDQVVNYLDRQLAIFRTTVNDKQITPSMINNYVKGEVLPSPISKKYNKEHLASIEQICTLKQVLSIAEVKQILDSEYDTEESKAEVFKTFNDLNNDKLSQAVLEAFKGLNEIDEEDTKGLLHLGLEFAITANAYISITKRILFLVRSYEFMKKKEKKEKSNQSE